MEEFTEEMIWDEVSELLTNVDPDDARQEITERLEKDPPTFQYRHIYMMLDGLTSNSLRDWMYLAEVEVPGRGGAGYNHEFSLAETLACLNQAVCRARRHYQRDLAAHFIELLKQYQ